MSTVLPVTLAGVKLLCGIGDTSQDTGITALIVLEQPALEYALDLAVLANAATDAGLQATLTLGAAEALAGAFLRNQARAPGATDDFHLGPLTISASRTDGPAQMAERLTASGAKRLEPFARAAKRVAYDASAGLLDGSAKAPLLAQTDSATSVFDLPPDCQGVLDYQGSEEGFR